MYVLLLSPVCLRDSSVVPVGIRLTIAALTEGHLLGVLHFQSTSNWGPSARNLIGGPPRRSSVLGIPLVIPSRRHVTVVPLKPRKL